MKDRNKGGFSVYIKDNHFIINVLCLSLVCCSGLINYLLLNLNIAF